MRILTVFRSVATASILVFCSFSLSCSRSPQAREANYLKRGEALRDKKDYSRALLEFKNAANAMPKDAEPYYQTGLTYLAAGSIRNAAQSFQKATDLNPKHQQAQLKLAELMTTSQKLEYVQQAASRLEEVLAASPDDSEANEALAFAEWKMGKTDEATTRLEDTLKKFPSRLQTSVDLARLKMARKDLAGAEQVLMQAVASAPQSSPAELALGQLYMISNQPAKAEAEFRKAVQLDPKNGAALLGLGAIQIAGNRMDEAEKTYLQASSLADDQYKPLHALFLFRQGKRDAALPELEKLAKDNPKDRGSRDRLFAAYVAMDKKDAARNLVNAALKKNPKDTDALFERAGLSLRAGNATDAERDIKEVLRFKPDFAEGHLVMAEISKAQGMTGNQRQELNEALRLKPSLLQARLTLARSYTLAREAQAALDLLNVAPAQQKGQLSYIIERNWALLELGENKELRSILDQVMRVKHFPEILIQDAVLRFQQGDYPDARTDAEEAVKNNPEDIRGSRILADTYIAQKQPAKAQQALQVLATAHPNSAALQNLLGQWYLSAKNPSAARQAFEAALAADPKNLPAGLALADVDHQEKHFDSAHQRLVALVAADPKNITVLLSLGSLAAEMNKRDESITRYRAVLAIDNSNLVALNNLAYTLAATDPEIALPYAQHAVELAPENATVQDTLGWIYYKKALYQTAVTYLEGAVKKEPTPRRQFHLAMSYLKLGDRDLGQKTLQLALQQDPTLPETEKGW